MHEQIQRSFGASKLKVMRRVVVFFVTLILALFYVESTEDWFLVVGVAMIGFIPELAALRKLFALWLFSLPIIVLVGMGWVLFLDEINVVFGKYTGLILSVVTILGAVVVLLYVLYKISSHSSHKSFGGK